MSTKHIIIFRHGETDSNRNNILQGQSDTELNSLGIQQAKSLANRLIGLKLEHIFSSDLSRAKQTGEIVRDTLGISITFTKELREVDVGLYQNKPSALAWKELGDDFYPKWKSDGNLHLRFPKGETKLQVITRVKNFIEDAARTSPYENFAVSTHGFVLRALAYACGYQGKEPISIPNCAAYEFEYNNSLKYTKLIKSD